MRVRDVMTKQITFCRTETNLAAASALMWDYNCAALLALTGSCELAGILTDRDICIALGTRNARASELMVRDVIGSSPLSCQSSDDILTALLIMQQAKVKFLPVVNDAGVLEGMLSIDDIVQSGDNQFASQW